MSSLWSVIKVLLILLLTFLMLFPIMPFAARTKKFSTIHALKYEEPHGRKNAWYVLLAVIECVLLIVIVSFFSIVVNAIISIPFINNLLNGASPAVEFIPQVIFAVLINIVTVYTYAFFKALLKKCILDPAFGFTKKEKKKNKKKKTEKNNDAETEETEKEEPAESEENKRVAVRESKKKDKNTEDDTKSVGEIAHNSFWGIFFEKPSLLYSKGWVIRCEKVLQIFIYFVEILYALLFMFLLYTVFFPAPPFIYNLLITVMQVQEWYLYPFVSIIFLQELCNVFHVEISKEKLKKIAYDEIKQKTCKNCANFDKCKEMPEIDTAILQLIEKGFEKETPLISGDLPNELSKDCPKTKQILKKINEYVKQYRDKIKDYEEKKNETEKQPEEEQKGMEENLRSLHLELQRRFDSEHNLRFYPEAGKDSALEYVCTNRPYASSLQFIQTKMKEKSGRIVQSYMECLDSAYNDKNVYFCASFYSELGEYLMHYAYTRLLAGSRFVFILSDRSRKNALRKYINDALMKLTGTTEDCTWRVYTSDERLDQADILIATPDDFKDDDLVENYPSFFEEVCNAIFIDADKIVELESYLCPIMAIRLQRATANRIRFVFLSQAVLRGFASASLPRFFCVDEVLTFSNASENEAVAFTLWNKESKRNVIYNKHGQTLTALETLIAEQAIVHGVDGVRIITSSPLDRADRDILAEHNIEINEFYKSTPDINYMIYSDDRCNLAAALYVSTRFRGVKKSLVHVISHPYLLREYFMDRMLSEEYINRSSFIQPRVTEHAEKSKLSFLRIFCDATTGDGMSVTEFEERMKTVMTVAAKRGDAALCPYCAQEIKLGEYSELNVEILAGYLVAALCDDNDTPIEKSVAKNIKDYYLIVDSPDKDGYTMIKDKKIAFKRVREIFDKVFACNERVKLCINDEIIGELDTFPSRVNVEYVVGQSIVFNNTEYEIGHISEDRKIIFLRHENVTFKNCLDTIFLRRYKINSEKIIGEDGVFNKTHGMLEEIRVSMRKADFRGETYGFYSLLSNCQTLDFVTGAVGNPHLSKNIIDSNARNVQEGKILRVTLTTRMQCNDKMRLLLSAVFNEFIRTVFPKAYRCISICPILEKPLEYNEQNEPKDYLSRIEALYPYLISGQDSETDPMRMQFVFFNDCIEDVGALDWFYDRLGHYMHEFLANVYSYLNWLKLRPNLKHYIYFGGETLPECFDLEGCCELLGDYNLILSDDGLNDYETASDLLNEESPKRCSFCGKILESGRYSSFNGRLICAECDKTSVREEDELVKAIQKAKDYLSNAYPEIMFGISEVKFFDKDFTKDDYSVSEICSRLDIENRIIYVEYETPENGIVASIIRGMIELWQYDNELLISCAKAQIEYEEIEYLKSIGYEEKVQVMMDKYEEYMRADINEISEYVQGGAEGKKNSFAFMRDKYSEVLSTEVGDDPTGGEGDIPVGLYDPNKIPRFWKRLLKGESVIEGEDKLSSDERTEEETETTEEEEEVASTEEPKGKNVTEDPTEIE